jgi:DDE superfamily endonuclease/Helix-turn-helix of DDE superfamily endonuclease
LIAYRAMVDVPKELVTYVARLLAAHRRAIGTPRGSRKLTCARQALMVLVWFRKNEDIALLAAGFGVSRATGYRYIAEGRQVLAAHAPDLHEALQQVAACGWAYVVLDGSLIGTDRLAETTTSVKGDTIDAWYSGKHRRPGGNIQAFMRPDGVPIWVSDVMPGHLHDLTCAERQQILAAACWAASQLNLPTLADCGYEGAGHGVYTPIRRPADGRVLAVDNRTYNSLLRAQRAVGERGFALLKGRWRVLRHVTASPRHIGDIARGALVLSTFLHDQHTQFR